MTSRDMTVFLIGFCASLVTYALFAMPGHEQKRVPTVAYSDFLKLIDDGQVTEVVFRGSSIAFTNKERAGFNSTVPPASAALEKAIGKGVKVAAFGSEEDQPGLATILLSWPPWILLLWFFVARPLYSVSDKLDRMGQKNIRPEQSTAEQ